MDAFVPKLVCFSCKFGWGYLNGHKLDKEKVPNWVPVTCSGKIETTHLLTAFKEGADGVLILACPEGHCHFQNGNWRTEKTVYLLQNLIQAFGIEPERVGIVFSSDPDGREIPRYVEEMETKIQKLGPVKSV